MYICISIYMYVIHIFVYRIVQILAIYCNSGVALFSIPFDCASSALCAQEPPPPLRWLSQAAIKRRAFDYLSAFTSAVFLNENQIMWQTAANMRCYVLTTKANMRRTSTYWCSLRYIKSCESKRLLPGDACKIHICFYKCVV